MSRGNSGTLRMPNELIVQAAGPIRATEVFAKTQEGK